MDAQWPGITSDDNDYITPFAAPIIMNGIVYMNTPITPNTAQYGYYAVSLYTGQQLWYKNGTDNGLNNNVVLARHGGREFSGQAPALVQSVPKLAFGQLLNYYSVNGAGVDSYLWMTQTLANGTVNWYMLDASTGNWILTLTGVPVVRK